MSAITPRTWVMLDCVGSEILEWPHAGYILPTSSRQDFLHGVVFHLELRPCFPPMTSCFAPPPEASERTPGASCRRLRRRRGGIPPRIPPRPAHSI